MYELLITTVQLCLQSDDKSITSHTSRVICRKRVSELMIPLEVYLLSMLQRYLSSRYVGTLYMTILLSIFIWTRYRAKWQWCLSGYLTLCLVLVTLFLQKGL